MATSVRPASQKGLSEDTQWHNGTGVIRRRERMPSFCFFYREFTMQNPAAYDRHCGQVSHFSELSNLLPAGRRHTQLSAITRPRLPIRVLTSHRIMPLVSSLVFAFASFSNLLFSSRHIAQMTP